MEVTSLYREPEAPAEGPLRALEFTDVFRIFGAGSAQTVALRGLSLRIDAGEFVALFGPSGSGKTTALQLGAGLDRPSAGDVRAFGRSLARCDEVELAAYRAREVAIVFQSRNLWPNLTATENVALSLRLAGKRRGVNAAAREALAVFGLEHRREERAAALSGGEQQRVAVAAAAARAAPLVLADEPTAELDARSEQVVLSSLLRLREGSGTTVVVVTHSARVAEAADRVVEIRDGTAQ